MTQALTARWEPIPDAGSPIPGRPDAPHWHPPPIPDQTELQDAIHEPHQKERDRYMDALAKAQTEDLRRMARTMAGCADAVHLYIDAATDSVHEYVHTCKCRLCPFCARRRSAHVADQLDGIVATMAHPRHLVLTVKSRPEDLAAQIHDLRHWFKDFRRTSFWKANVCTGVYTMEVTINEHTGLWHPHLHILFDGEYLPFKQVQRLWHDITGGSEIVWIEEVYNRQGAVRELTKYIGKPQKAAHWTDAQLREYASATRGARMVQSFGRKTPTPVQDLTPETPVPREAWSVSVARLVYLAGLGDPYAVKVLPLIADRWPHLARYIYQKMPQLEPDQTRAERLLAAMHAIESGHAVRKLAHPPPGDPAALDVQIVQLLKELRAAEPWEASNGRAPRRATV